MTTIVVLTATAVVAFIGYRAFQAIGTDERSPKNMDALKEIIRKDTAESLARMNRQAGSAAWSKNEQGIVQERQTKEEFLAPFRNEHPDLNNVIPAEQE